MKFPLFSKRPAVLQAADDGKAALDRWAVRGFRALGILFTRAAERLEEERLRRQGYGEQERFLERVDKREPPKR